MKEYPHTSQEFKVNGKVQIMKKLTLGLGARIEDDNITVTLVEVLKTCTDMSDDEIMALDADQLQGIYVDVVAFTSGNSESGDGERKKPSS